jgi:uncharacterized protein
MIDHSVRRIQAGAAGGFDVWEAAAPTPGPRVVVLGGVHGDETHGIVAAGRLATDETPLLRGSVSIVPICHEAAFLTDSRTSSIDGGNLARLFPGCANGEPTAQLAHHLFTEVLSGADLLIDLHTSGRDYDMPFLAGYHGATSATHSLARRASATFGATFSWRHPTLSPGRTISVVDQAIYVECPGSGSMTPSAVEDYVDGVRRVLTMLDMIEGSPPARRDTSINVTGGGDLDRDMVSVRHDGMLLTDVVVGQQVEQGQRLGTIVTPTGDELEELRAPAHGWVMAVRRRPPVSAGDLVVMLAGDDEPDGAD